MSVKDFSTSIRVQIDSHNFGRYDISKSVLDFQMEKAIRQAGSCALTLAPHAEFMDMMEANDIINVYVNLNASAPENDSQHVYNRGWVRIFFGYVNDIRRDESVDPEGVYTVRYSLSASDFQKAIDKTEIYNNPYLDFREEFGRNIASSYLMRQGVVDQGNPRFLIMNHLAALLGFGKQWVLPPHYKDVLEDEVATDFIASPVQQNDQLAGFLRDDNKRIKNDALSHIQEIRKLAEDYTFAFANNEEVYRSPEETDEAAPAHRTLGERLAYAREQAELNLEPVQVTIDIHQPRVLPRSIYDVLCFDYMEYTDGYTLTPMFWEFAGPLYSLIEKDSHPVLNELCFDLRPTIDMIRPDHDGLGNELDGALAMVPCVVHREYPYTYWPDQAFDRDYTEGNELYHPEDRRLFNVQRMRPDTDSGSGQTPQPTRLDFGGAVFLQSDRVTNYGGTLGWNVEHALGIRDYGKDTSVARLHEFNRGPRVLDRIEISNRDVYGSSLGRGDQDVITGYDYVPNNVLGEDYRFYWRDITPQFRLLPLRRHGLRMLERSSNFAFPLGQGSALDVEGRLSWSVSIGRSTVDVFSIGQSLDQYMAMRVIIMTDHWYQHNAEYLNGTITLGPMPGLRPGYKLIWPDRNLEFYVESVSHQWSFPSMFVTTAVVSRGQPIVSPLEYVYPDSRRRGERADTFRLGISFPVADPEYAQETPENSLSTLFSPHTGNLSPRQRVVTPGLPGKYSPEILFQNYSDASPKVGAPDGRSDLGDLTDRPDPQDVWRRLRTPDDGPADE